MATIKVPYLVEKPGRHGRVRYFWQPGRRLRALGWRPQRLPDDPAAAIAAAQKLNDELARWRAGEPPLGSPCEARRAKQGTINDLISRYKRSEAWQRLAPSTQRGYRQCFERIARWSGDMPARALTPGLVQQFYTSMAGTPAFANATIRALRLLLAWARRADLVGGENPAARPSLRDRSAKGRLWPAEAVTAFVAAADRMGWHSMGTAVMLDEWIGQREGDVIALARSVWRDGALHLRQAKTGAMVVLPIGMVQKLVARLEAELARHGNVVVLGDAPLLVCESTGRPWRSDHFRHTFAAIRAAAGDELAGLWFLHLRHTAVTRLAEAGCELPLIASVTGHSLATVETIVDRYLIRTAAMARAAFQKRLDMEKA